MFSERKLSSLTPANSIIITGFFNGTATCQSYDALLIPSTMLFVLRICALLMLVLLPTNADEYHPKAAPPLFSVRETDVLRIYLHTLGPVNGYEYVLVLSCRATSQCRL